LHSIPDVPAPQDTRGTEPLILLVTPSDRHGDAARLASADFRVITTSRSESSVRQILAAGAAVIAIELVPALEQASIEFASQVGHLTRQRGGPSILLFGPAISPPVVDQLAALRAQWVPLPETAREELVAAVRAAVDRRAPLVASVPPDDVGR
jgi:methylmalonyl-CoA mutase cobalamin-binding subunit